MTLFSSTSLAANAYALGADVTAPKRDVLIFSLGGGNLEVSVMTLEGDIVEVVAVRGDAHMGGEDFTWRMMEHFQQVRFDDSDSFVNIDSYSQQRHDRVCMLFRPCPFPHSQYRCYDSPDWMGIFSRSRGL